MSREGKPEIDIQFSAKEKLRAYARFLKIIWQYNKALAVFRFTIILLGAFLQPLEVYFFSLFVAAIAASNTESALALLSVVIASYGLRRLVNELTWSQADDWFMKASSAATQQKIWECVAKLKPEALTEDEIRRSLDFVREDLWRLNRLAGNSEWMLRSILKFFGAAALAFAAPWWISFLVLIDAGLQALNLRLESKNDVWAATWNSIEGRRIEYTRYVFLEIRHFLQLRLLGGEKLFLKKYIAANQNILNRFKKLALKSIRNRTLLTLIHVGAYAIVIIIMGQKSIADPQNLAALFIALNLFGLMGESLNGISGSITKVLSDMQILAYIDRLMEKEPEKTTGLPIPKQPLVLEFKNVSYKYEGGKKFALKNINLKIREGEHIAIVGENGAGKTTLLKLLSGLDRPTSGKILLNGRELKDYIPSKWRSVFHLMMQDALLYEDFLLDNLFYGVDKKNKADTPYQKALHISGSDVVISSLPEKERTFIGGWAAPPGITPQQVSGGQEQRLLISRTLIHGGRIIGFDEPTSAMDANAEMRFFERMLKASGSRGLIFISHRFSTVRRAQRIIVFHEGELQAQGSHEELIKKPGKYSELYNEQAKWYN
ncbi:MAG: ATP-binding cassette domain-containing protein [Patescibacteria group bacterium]